MKYIRETEYIENKHSVTESLTLLVVLSLNIQYKSTTTYFLIMLFYFGINSLGTSKLKKKKKKKSRIKNETKFPFLKEI